MVPHLSKPDYCIALGLAVGGQRYITQRFESRFFVLSPERRTDYKNAAQALPGKPACLHAQEVSYSLVPNLISARHGDRKCRPYSLLRTKNSARLKFLISAHQHRRQSKVSPLATSIHACMGEKDLNCVGCGIRQHPLAHKLVN